MKSCVAIFPAPKNLMKMPAAIQRRVRRQNIQFMHSRMQYSIEYFQFIRKLVTCNAALFNIPQGQDQLGPDAEELAMISIQLASRSLFSVGFHTKKTLRGPATEWYDALYVLLRSSRNVRRWFAQHVLFAHPSRFSEYLLECPSSEVNSNRFSSHLQIGSKDDLQALLPRSLYNQHASKSYCFSYLVLFLFGLGMHLLKSS